MNNKCSLKILFALLLSLFLDIHFDIHGVAADIKKDNSQAVAEVSGQKQKDDIYKELELFGNVFSCVEKEYVSQPNTKKMIEKALNGMVSSLDPHSSYLTAEESRAMSEITKGEFAGIGVVVTMDHGFVKVVSPMIGTPASKAGILAGDLITKVDGQSVTEHKLEENVKRMRGKIGTVVKLTISRKNVTKAFDVNVRRDRIKIEDVRFSLKDDGKIGYIRLLEFAGHTQEDLKDAILKLQKQAGKKIKGYVLDMRLNPGGLLDQAVKVSDLFLEDGEIVSTKGRSKRSMLRFDATKGDILQNAPLVVLINGGTASAAEIVAGALQDNKRAKIVGTRSFGKGSVQTVIPLGDNGSLRLTTALYYTPKGVSIQGHGIDPDYVVTQPLPKKYRDLKLIIGESELDGHIKGNIEDKKGSGSSAYVPAEGEEDRQLKAACDLIEGKDISKMLEAPAEVKKRAANE